MKGKTSAATLGLVGGLALGVWIGSEMTSGREAVAPGPAVVTTHAAEVPAVTPQPAKPKRVTRVARVSGRAAAVEAPAPFDVAQGSPERSRGAPESAPKLMMTIPVSAPELHARMKPVLARGTKLPLAADGFRDAEQFATVAHAAKNTQVPFTLLKHRVIVEGQSLEKAIRASKPDSDARGEVARARASAKSDITALTNGNATMRSSNQSSVVLPRLRRGV